MLKNKIHLLYEAFLSPLTADIMGVCGIPPPPWDKRCSESVWKQPADIKREQRVVQGANDKVLTVTAQLKEHGVQLLRGRASVWTTLPSVRLWSSPCSVSCSLTLHSSFISSVFSVNQSERETILLSNFTSSSCQHLELQAWGVSWRMSYWKPFSENHHHHHHHHYHHHHHRRHHHGQQSHHPAIHIILYLCFLNIRNRQAKLWAVSLNNFSTFSVWFVLIHGSIKIKKLTIYIF